MPEETIVKEADAVAPAQDNSPATPAEPKEATVVNEKIDPRIVEIVGEEKIESAFGEQPKEEAKPAEEKKEEVKEENQEQKVEEKEVDVPAITPPDSKPTRLDRRLASRYIHNLHLKGEKDLPTEESVIADLKKYSKEEKIQALHFHLQMEKELRGEKPTGDDLDEEDKEAIQDAERESIRNEILAEEHEKGVKTNFVQFIDNHPELVEGQKDYNPKLAKAVETLWRGGMSVREAFDTVTEQIQAVKDAQVAEEKKEKSAALSGVLNGAGQTPTQEKALDWPEVQRIEREDPALYRRMLAEGKFKHLM